MKEELGIKTCVLEFLYKYIHSNPYESELVYTYTCTYDGEIYFNIDEIDEVRFWGIDKIKESIGKGIFSGNFEHEFASFMEFKSSKEI